MKKLLIAIVFMIFAHQHHATATRAAGSGTLTVLAQVNISCTVSSASLDFGNYTPGTSAPAITQLANFTVRCSTINLPYYVGLGSGSSGNITARTMQATNSADGITTTTSTLAYQLYLDNQYTKIWGTDTTKAGQNQGTSTLKIALLAGESFTVYGKINAGLSPAPGYYSDSVIISVIY